MWDTSASEEQPTPAGLEPSRRRECPATHSMAVPQNVEPDAQKPCGEKKSTKLGQKDQRYTLSEAWRLAGLDELEVAETFPKQKEFHASRAKYRLSWRREVGKLQSAAEGGDPSGAGISWVQIRCRCRGGERHGIWALRLVIGTDYKVRSMALLETREP
jgi:hypothetical protein